MKKLFGGMVLLSVLAWQTAAHAASKPEEIEWDDLVPKVAMEAPPPSALDGPWGTELDASADEPMMDWLYGTEAVDSLDGKHVKIPGFVVPLDSDEGGLLKEFLLVPYLGACIHTPPPPANQVVYVKLNKPKLIRDIWTPYWITGVMEVKPFIGDIAETVYQLRGEAIGSYDY